MMLLKSRTKGNYYQLNPTIWHDAAEIPMKTTGQSTCCNREAQCCHRWLCHIRNKTELLCRGRVGKIQDQSVRWADRGGRLNILPAKWRISFFLRDRGRHPVAGRSEMMTMGAAAARS